MFVISSDELLLIFLIYLIYKKKYKVNERKFYVILIRSVFDYFESVQSSASIMAYHCSVDNCRVAIFIDDYQEE